MLLITVSDDHTTMTLNWIPEGKVCMSRTLDGNMIVNETNQTSTIYLPLNNTIHTVLLSIGKTASVNFTIGMFNKLEHTLVLLSRTEPDICDNKFHPLSLIYNVISRGVGTGREDLSYSHHFNNKCHYLLINAKTALYHNYNLGVIKLPSCCIEKIVF